MHRRAFPLLLLAFSVALSATAQTAVPPAPPAEPSSATPQVSPQLQAAESRIAVSDWKGAEGKLAAYLTAHPDDARALFDAGYVAEALQKDDDAAGFYSRAVKAEPNRFEARLAYGLLLARHGKLDEARPQLQAATTLDPGEAGPALKARAWRALAEIDRRNDPAQASTDLLEALKISPETPRDTLLAAELAEQSGQIDAAEAAYRRVLAKDPKSAEAQAGLAQILIRKKQYPEAEQLLRLAMQQAPDNPGLNAELATTLAAQNKPEALPLLQKLHDAHPQDENISRMLADVLSDAGNPAAADQLYTALLAGHPNDPELLVAHGQDMIRLERFPQALDAFSKAAQIDPSNPDAWSGVAFAASKTGQPSMTLHALTMRSRYLPESASTYFLWATSYDSVHDRAAAITYYHHFLEAAAGKFPDQEWQARQRLLVLEKKH
ncbi:MAG: tetratricopeptide repeat protein [Acidobacteriota bacterium]